MDFLNNFFNNAGAFIAVFIGFCFLIFVHELGHYLAAKLSGVKVLQFAIGMGPAVFSWRKGVGFRAGSTEPEYDQRIREHLLKKIQAQDKHDTTSLADLKPTNKQIDEAAAELGLGECEYRLSWFPLGGYVKMLGQEDGNPGAVSADPRAYNNASGIARAFILIAGVTMNLITGLMMFVVAFLAGVAFPPAQIGAVIPGKPASRAVCVEHPNDPAYTGLRPGDKIVAFNSEPVGDFTDFAAGVVLTKAGRPANVTVERQDADGQTQRLTYQITPETDARMRLMSVGVTPALSLSLADSPNAVSTELAAAGVKPGMTIVQANGKPITRIDQLERAVNQSLGAPVELTFQSPQTANDTAAPAVQQQARIALTPTPELTRSPDDVVNYMGLVPLVQIASVVDDSPASKAGVQAGDIILQINATRWPREIEFIETIRESRGKPVELTVSRAGTEVKLPPITPRRGIIGVNMGRALDSNLVSGQTGTTGFATLNLASGSRILSVAGQPVSSFGQIQAALIRAIRQQAPALAADSASTPEKAPARPVTVDVEYQSNILNQPVIKGQITLSPQLQESILESGWNLSVYDVLRPLMVPVSASNPIDATLLGIRKTHNFVIQTYVTIQRLFERSVPASEMRGPIGIVSIGTQVYQNGWTYYLYFFGLISINLVVMNLLPIPILDGGQLVFLAIEKLKGSPVSIRIQEYATYVGLAIIGCLMVMTFYFDIMRLFS